MKQIKGTITNLKENLIGRYCNSNNLLINDKILFCKNKPLFNIGIKGYIVPKGKTFKTNLPILEINSDIPFKENDIISINPDGSAISVWENTSPHNALYVTDLCNSKCIMCPQTEGNQSRYDECMKLLDLIKLNPDESIGITGGEPTLNIDKLTEILNKISKKSPKQMVHILTNGRLFKNPEIVEKIANVRNLDLSVGIPLYSDIAEEHDAIVGIKGAFIETVQGLYNLAKKGINIEIRIVILRQNYKKLKNIAEYIYRNLPFVFHVALMGMEYKGNAETNYNIVSIDPIDYKKELYEAIREFLRYDMCADIYNLPLCVVDERIKSFCKDSISTWKKTFLPQCINCTQKSQCSGVFETSFVHSKNIKPAEVH